MINDQINIMHILPTLQIGGMENALVRLINSLDENKYSNYICCVEDSGLIDPLAKKITNKSVKILKLTKGNGIDLTLCFKIAKLIQDNNIDILHARNFGSILYVSFAKLFSGSKVSLIADIRGKHIKKHYKIMGFLSGLINKFVAVTSDIADELESLGRINASKVEVIHNGIEVDNVRRETLDVRRDIDLGIREGDLVIGTVGRLAEVKDYPTLIKAFVEVKKEIQNAKLLFVGDGPERQKLEDLAKSENVDKDVIFLGFKQNVADYYAIMDVFVLTSIREGSSNTILEAMASSLPVIATDTGGNKEIIENGKSGLLFEVGDVAGLAELIVKALSCTDMATRLKESAFERIKTGFGFAKTVEKYKRIYESVFNE